MSESTVVKEDSELGEAGKEQPVGSSEIESQEPCLLPCPFCGSDSVIWSDCFQRVRCNGCFMGTSAINPAIARTDETTAALKLRCFTAWNTRAEDVETLRTQLAEKTAENEVLKESLRLKAAFLNSANSEIAQLVEERSRLRQRLFGNGQVEGGDHSTACSLWGDDGQGHAKGFAALPPCNCGALINWEKKQLAEKTARVMELEAAIEASRSASTVLGLVQRTETEAAERMRRACVARVRKTRRQFTVETEGSYPLLVFTLNDLITGIEAITLTGEEDAEAETTV